jgi:hypothetical protein
MLVPLSHQFAISCWITCHLLQACWMTDSYDFIRFLDGVFYSVLFGFNGFSVSTNAIIVRTMKPCFACGIQVLITFGRSRKNL